MHLFELVDKNANYLVDHSYFVGNHQIGLLILDPFLSSISDFAVNPYWQFSPDKIDTLDQGILALRSRKRQSGFIVDFIKRPEQRRALSLWSI